MGTRKPIYFLALNQAGTLAKQLLLLFQTGSRSVLALPMTANERAPGRTVAWPSSIPLSPSSIFLLLAVMSPVLLPSLRVRL